MSDSINGLIAEIPGGRSVWAGRYDESSVMLVFRNGDAEQAIRLSDEALDALMAILWRLGFVQKRPSILQLLAEKAGSTITADLHWTAEIVRDAGQTPEHPRCVCGHFLTGDTLCRECGRAQADMKGERP
jgi:hypothetical protein